MTDIMARLRRVRNDAEGYAIDVDIDLLFKAAREIERLRAALQPDILADKDVRKTAPALEKRADILPDTAAAVADERAAIVELIDSERDRVPKTGEYYAGYREALRNLEAAINARSTSPDADSHKVAAAPPIDPALFEGLKTFKDVPVPGLPGDGNKG